MFNLNNSLSNNKSGSDDGISAYYSQVAAIVISLVLAHLTSLLLTFGVPIVLENSESNTVPVYKSGNKDEKTTIDLFLSFPISP